MKHLLLLLALLGGRMSSASDAETWWAFQPVRVAGGGHTVDGFIDKKLVAAKLPKAPPAERRALLRRVTFDLTGLPPTPEDMAVFLADKSEQAFAKVVERLLASPHYGERWGRWWLDVARYADSNGQDENKVLGNAWRYRDWVIRAFNTSQPFDQFITEQLAGDLLPPIADERKNFDHLIATGFLVLGPKMLAEQDKPKLVMDIVDEQIDTVGRTFLGLTLGCARCHDHKFDPVPARDYYAMAGIFKSTRTMEDLAFVSKFNERPIATKEELAAIAAHDRRMAELTNRVAVAMREANAALVSEWKRDFPRALADALELNRSAGLRPGAGTGSSHAGSETGAPGSSPADASSNLGQRLRDLLAPDPATNAASRALRDVATAPDRASDWLKELESAGSTNEVRDAIFGKKGLFTVSTNARPLYPSATREALAALERERDACQTSAPPRAAQALAVAEDRPVDVPVHLRGSHLTLASNAVPRGFVRVVAERAAPPPIPPERSGRLELARWLTAPENPLTARVIVNRLWQAHFGEGLVRTPDNFGLRGEPPTHPALLDWLAAEFIRSGWDVKAMHRLMVNSAVYQRSSLMPSSSRARTTDPDNRLLSYFPRQRLEAEMIRDAVLAVSGRLDRSMGGSLVNWKNNEYVPGDEVSAKSVRRTVYLPIVRDRVFDALTIFDFANPGVCTARRTPTVVSHQALFFLNSPLVKDSAAALAATLLSRADLDDGGRVREAYARILNRPATRSEVRRVLRFLQELPREGTPSAPDEERRRDDFAALCQTLFAANEFVYRP